MVLVGVFVIASGVSGLPGRRGS